MKRSCKEIDITDPQTIEPWVYGCLEGHKDRHDFRRLFCGIGGMSRPEYEQTINSTAKEPLAHASVLIAKEAARRIRERNLSLPPVCMREKIDQSSGKIRLIGKESAMQQILDHVAVKAAEEIFRRRIVKQQASSITGRGQVYGTKMIQRWVRKDNRAAHWAKVHGKKYSKKCKYFVKMDMKKCYQSMRLETFMEKFRRDCGNEELLWLWETLLKTHRVDGYEGFMIGALPSQWGCQYIMSFIYRFAMDLCKERRGKTRKLITHGLIYMDDMLFTAASRRDLKMAVNRIIQYAREEFGLTIKPDWQIQELKNTPIDMMGFVIHADGNITIRPRIFLRARRMALRSNRRKGKQNIKQAKRICSYKGYFKHSNSRKIGKKLNLDRVFKEAAKTISRKERRKHEKLLQQRTGTPAVHAAA